MAAKPTKRLGNSAVKQGPKVTVSPLPVSAQLLACFYQAT